MAASREDIRRWLGEAKNKGATHMIIVCDTFNYIDYPVYVMPEEDALQIATKHDGPNMTMLMEVYNLSIDFDTQLGKPRVFNY